MTQASTLAFMGMGTPEMIFIAVIALLLFGGKNLPHAARSFGRAMREFKKASADIERELKSAIEDEPVKTTPKLPADTAPASPEEETYDYTEDYYHDDFSEEEHKAAHPEENSDAQQAVDGEQQAAAGQQTDENPPDDNEPPVSSPAPPKPTPPSAQ